MINDLLTARPRVLVIDDEPMSRAMMHTLLRTEDRYEVLTTSDGADSLEAIRRLGPDLLLLDAQLSGPLDGFSICRALKSAPKTRRVPIVLVTSSPAATDRVQVLEAGADDFLSKPFNRMELLARVRSLLRIKALSDQLDEVESVIYSLSRVVEAREGGDYEAHTDRVIRYTEALAHDLGLPDEALRVLGQAAMLRDLGKIGLPDHILNKPGALDAEEHRCMQSHAEIGAQIISPLRSTAALMPIIRHHHERIDGKGYPDGLTGSQIPLGARIVAIADAFDAMLSHRPYRPALSPSKALTTLQAGAGKQWDARLVDLFVAWVQRQPINAHNLK